MSVDSGGGNVPPPEFNVLSQTGLLIRTSLNIISEDIMDNGYNEGKRPADDNLLLSPPQKVMAFSRESNIEEITKETNSDNLINNRFKITDSGPYFVFIEHNQHLRLHPMKIGKMLFGDPKFKNKDAIGNITSVGYSRIKIEVNSSIKANSLIKEDLFKQNNLKVYIPNFLVCKYGVIRNVDICLSEQEILSEIRSEVKVSQVRRLNRKEKIEDKVIWKPSYSCLLKFDGQSLPKYVYIYGTRCEVNPYIAPVRQCFNCLRYGHIKTHCKSTETRCSKCGDKHERANCKSKDPPKCIHCEGTHSSMYKGCQEYKKMQKIKLTMTTNNLTFNEAKKMFNQKTYASVLTSNDTQVNENKHKHFKITQRKSIKNNKNSHSDTNNLPPSDLYYDSNNLHQAPITNPYPPMYHNMELKNSLKNILGIILPHIMVKFQENERWFENQHEVENVEQYIDDSITNYYDSFSNTC